MAKTILNTDWSNENSSKTVEFATAVEIFADDAATLEEIEILRPVKIENAPNHPDFEVTDSDLDEYAAHFKASVRKGVPIDIEHRTDPKYGKQAAGWIKDVYTKIKEDGSKALMAKAEFNELGKELVGDKRFPFLSPEFVPRNYKDPEAKMPLLNNVLKAVTLTTMPLFKGLPALRASEKSTSGLTHQLLDNIIYAEEDKGESMNLDTIRTKALADLSDAEKSFLTDHKAELSADEQTKFALVEAPTDKGSDDKGEVTAKPEAKAEAVAVGATETVTISASELNTMKAQIAALEIKANEGHLASQKLLEKETADFVGLHVKRGAIKAGEAEATTKMILASEDSAGMKKLIENLPDRTVVAGEIGQDSKPSLDTAGAALEAKTKEIMASDEGKGLDYVAALKLAIAADADLSKEYQANKSGGIE